MVLHWSRGFRNFKIGGCLTAVRKEEARYWVTVGVGINYNLEDFSNIDQPTISVKSFLNSFGENCKWLHRENDFTKDEFLKSVQKFAKLFLDNLEFIQHAGLAAFYEGNSLEPFGSKRYWLYLGQKVTIFDEDKKQFLTGRFEALTDDGALQLACDDGRTEVVLNGMGLKLA
jgi:biotin-(acetyl-CoA carboxylase) ligase